MTLVPATSKGVVDPLTTKGDLFTFSTADARLGVGTDGQVLTADAAQATGNKWGTGAPPSGAAGGDLTGTYPNPTLAAAPILKSLTTTKGDLIAATAASTPARLGVGADGLVVRALASATPGLLWDKADNYSAKLGGVGIISESFPREAATATQLLVDGTIYGVAIGLIAGQTVTNVIIYVDTQGTLITLSKVGLYTTAGARLARSADQGTAWQSSVLAVVPMITPYLVTATGVYYTAVIAKTTGVMPTLSRGSNTTTGSGAIGAGPALCVTQTAQTDLIDPATFTAAKPSLWMGVS